MPEFCLPVFVEPCKPTTLSAVFKRCESERGRRARARLADFMKPATEPTGRVAFPSDHVPVVFPGKADFGRVGTVSNIPITVPLHFLGRDEDIDAIGEALRAGTSSRAKRDASLTITGCKGLPQKQSLVACCHLI